MHAASIITTTAVATLLALAACAPGPDAIQPVSMGSAFVGISCQQAAIERNAAAQRLEALSAAQRGAQAGDAISVFLIGVPLASVSGGNKAGEIAAEKGKLAALDARLLSCR